MALAAATGARRQSSAVNAEVAALDQLAEDPHRPFVRFPGPRIAGALRQGAFLGHSTEKIFIAGRIVFATLRHLMRP